MCIVNNMNSKFCNCQQVKSLQEYRSHMVALQAVKREAANQLEGPVAKMARTIEPSRSTKRFKCNPCDIGYYVQDHLNTHINRQHGGNFNVSASAPQDSRILINVDNGSSNTGKIAVQTPIPNRAPTNLNIFNGLVKNLNKTISADINGIVKNLNRRISASTPSSRRFHCDDCKKSFGNEPAFKQHVIIMHNKVGVRNFPAEDEPENLISSIFGERTLVLEKEKDLPKPNKYSWSGHYRTEPKSKSAAVNSPKPKASKRVYIQKKISSFRVPTHKKTSFSKRGVAKPDQPWKTDPLIPHPHQMTPSTVCMALGLNDYPVPVNKFNQEYFKHRPHFDEYIFPLLRTVNPAARHFEILTLGQAKWYEVILTELQDLEIKE